ncbi:hypothetical protein Pelo_12353 [Pelomyxa schiedti]|nr:hypothetical protein Pelo_12353 [Pelomyxa schiedti]
MASETAAQTLHVARLVWDHVVAPGWLSTTPRGGTSHKAEDVTMFAAAEAMFPLVALVCNKVMAEYVGGGRTYRALSTAAMAGSSSCIAWILNRHHSRRRTGVGEGADVARDAHNVVVKEVAAVLFGLCSCGHLQMASRLLGSGIGTELEERGTFPELWDGRRVRWRAAVSSFGENAGSPNDVVATNRGVEVTMVELREYLRASCGKYLTLVAAIRAGNVDIVRWLLDSVLMIGRKDAPWALSRVLTWAAAKRDCKMEALRWLIDEFGLADRLDSSTALSLALSLASGNEPDNIKWFLQKFPGVVEHSVFSQVLINRYTSVELCKWMQAEGHATDYMRESTVESIKNADVAMWVMTTFSVDLSADTCNQLCGSIGDVELTQWLVTKKGFTPTLSSFISACSTRRGDALLALWLARRVKLSPIGLQFSMQGALSVGNFAVVNWLEETFHMMELVNGTQNLAGNVLEGLCTSQEQLQGLKWFTQRLTQPFNIGKAAVFNALSRAAASFCTDTILFILETFTEFKHKIQKNTPLLERLFLAITTTDLKKIQHLVALTEPSFLTPQLVCGAWRHRCLSSKVVKWLTTTCPLESDDIKDSHNLLFAKLLQQDKNGCLEWLIDRFGITLDDFKEVSSRSVLTTGDPFYITFSSWKLLVRKFPGINAPLIRYHLMSIATSSPFIASFTMEKFGITLDEIRKHWSRRSCSDIMRLWLAL